MSLKVYEKAYNVVESCETFNQLLSAVKYVKLANKNLDTVFSTHLHEKIVDKYNDIFKEKFWKK